MLSIFNESKTLQEWLIDKRCAIGLYPKLFRVRMRQKMSPEEALTKPVPNPPNGMGQYLYGYPYKICEEIAPNYCVLPDDPDSYTLWVSKDKLRNLHCRSGKVIMVSSFRMVGTYDSYFEALRANAADEEIGELLKVFE